MIPKSSTSTVSYEARKKSIRLETSVNSDVFREVYLTGPKLTNDYQQQRPQSDSIQEDKLEVLDMAAIVTFDASLKAKSLINLEKIENYRFHVKYLSKLKYIFLVLYLFIDPFIMTPAWCLEHATEEQKGMLYDCSAVRFGNGEVQYSNFTVMSPRIIYSIDLICVLFFLLVTYSKKSFQI